MLTYNDFIVVFLSMDIFVHKGVQMLQNASWENKTNQRVKDTGFQKSN